MDWITPILKVLAKNKGKQLTSREILFKVFQLPEMVIHKDQYKEMQWTDLQIIDQLYKDNQNQTNLTFNRLSKDGFIKTTDLKKGHDKLFFEKHIHVITELGLEKFKKDKGK